MVIRDGSHVVIILYRNTVTIGRITGEVFKEKVRRNRKKVSHIFVNKSKRKKEPFLFLSHLRKKQSKVIRYKIEKHFFFHFILKKKTFYKKTILFIG